jgi:hypothetical protein
MVEFIIGAWVGAIFMLFVIAILKTSKGEEK